MSNTAMEQTDFMQAAILRDAARGLLREQEHLRPELLAGHMSAVASLLARAHQLERRHQPSP